METSRPLKSEPLLDLLRGYTGLGDPETGEVLLNIPARLQGRPGRCTVRANLDAAFPPIECTLTGTSLAGEPVTLTTTLRPSRLRDVDLMGLLTLLYAAAMPSKLIPPGPIEEEAALTPLRRAALHEILRRRTPDVALSPEYVAECEAAFAKWFDNDFMDAIYHRPSEPAYMVEIVRVARTVVAWEQITTMPDRHEGNPEVESDWLFKIHGQGEPGWRLGKDGRRYRRIPRPEGERRRRPISIPMGPTFKREAPAAPPPWSGSLQEDLTEWCKARGPSYMAGLQVMIEDISQHKAARLHRVSQPSVSRAIEAIKRHAGKL